MKSCFYIGHRESDERLLPQLIALVERLIEEKQVTFFYVGGYGGFDRVAAAAVKVAKRKYSEITLLLVLPYNPAERTVETPFGFDGTYYPDGLENVPKRYAIARVNKIMIDASDWLVAYVCHGASNSKALLEYAERRQRKGLIQIENLADYC